MWGTIPTHACYTDHTNLTGRKHLMLHELNFFAKTIDYTVRKTDGEYRLAPKGVGREDKAYYTTDVWDCLDTMHTIQHRRSQGYTN